MSFAFAATLVMKILQNDRNEMKILIFGEAKNGDYGKGGGDYGDRN